MFGDRLVWYPVDTTAHIHASDVAMKRKKKNVYQYKFAHRGENSFTDAFNISIGKDCESEDIKNTH